jgi:hypothetical protein
MNNHLNICDLCEMQCNTKYFKIIDDLSICCSCARNNYGPSDLFTSINDIILKDDIECPVCYENKRGIKLPKCNHFCCIDCFKSLYFGYTNDKKSENFYNQSNVIEDIYDQMFPIIENDEKENDEKENDEKENDKQYYRFNEYEQWCYDYYFAEDENEKQVLYKNRYKWMQTPEFLKWEKEKNKKEKEDYDRDNIQNEYFYEKYKKRNPYCPLCRK